MRFLVEIGIDHIGCVFSRQSMRMIVFILCYFFHVANIQCVGYKPSRKLRRGAWVLVHVNSSSTRKLVWSTLIISKLVFH